jgi:serine-type D-Ala-D-Ala carboxypeptidase (penicillin-binding protein 5/6)
MCWRSRRDRLACHERRADRSVDAITIHHVAKVATRHIALCERPRQERACPVMAAMIPRNIAPLAFTMLLLLAGAKAGFAAALQIDAPYAFLIDDGTGAVLFAKNADAPMSPASTTKILTAEIIFREIEEGRLNLDDTAAISPRAAREGDAESGGSSMFAQANSRVRVEDLRRGLLITSGNDAAIALAEDAAGAEEAFVALMNKRARELGMTRSHFTNAWGEGSPGQKVTARDMARLTAYVTRTYPQYYKYFGEAEFTWNNIRQHNRNPLLGMNIGADGVKTGHLASSGYGLVGSAVQNGHRLILVLNGARTERERASEARKLLEWGFRALGP